jgi:hypothetical protein
MPAPRRHDALVEVVGTSMSFFRSSFLWFSLACACTAGGGGSGAPDAAGSQATGGVPASGLSAGAPSTGGSGGSGGTQPPALPALGGAPQGGAGGTSSAGGTGDPVVPLSGPCTALGLFLCDDFEIGAPGQAPDAEKWTIDLINSQGIFLDDKVAYRGGQSVKVVGDGYRAFLRPRTGLPVSTNTFYLRVFLRSDSAMGPGHSTYLEAGKNAMDEHELRIGYHYRMLEINMMPGDPEQLSSGKDYDDGTPGLSFAPNTWYCLEVLFDGANHEARVWVNDEEVSALHVTDWNPNQRDGFTGYQNWAPSYASAGVGYEKYSGDPATLHYDDVAFGISRIGCN